MKRRGATAAGGATTTGSAAGRRKWPNGVKKCGLAALPDDVQTSPFARPLPRPATLRPPTSAGGQENSIPRPPPIPFLRFCWGAGRPMKRPTAPHFPAVAKTFFKISLGGRVAFLGKKGHPHSHPPSRHPPALLRGNEKSGGRRSVRKRSANPQNPKRRNKPALSAPRRNPHSGRALPRAAAGNRRRRRRGPENFSRIAHFLLLFLKKILTSGIFCAILYKT